MQKNYTCKILAVGIIVLFIGVSYSTAISVDNKTCVYNNIQVDDNKSVDESNVEIIVTTYGIGKTENFKVLLTKEESDRLEMIINELEFKLKKSKFKVQTLSIIKWVFDNFQELNLFKKYNGNRVKKLFTGGLLNLRFGYDTELANDRGRENFNCFIIGTFGFSSALGFWDGEGPILSILYKLAEYSLIIALLTFPIFLYRQCYGPEYGGYITIGDKYHHYDQYGWPLYGNSAVQCDIWTLGNNGTKEWTGKHYGQIRIIYDSWEDDAGRLWEDWDYVGVEGFTGIKFLNLKNGKIFIIGRAEHIALDTDIPK